MNDIVESLVKQIKGNLPVALAKRLRQYRASLELLTKHQNTYKDNPTDENRDLMDNTNAEVIVLSEELQPKLAAIISKEALQNDPPANDPPANDPPANDPPANDPPANDPPANDPPANDPPANDPPANDPPANDPPANDPPANDPPANDPPANDPPANDPPAFVPPVHVPVPPIDKPKSKVSVLGILGIAVGIGAAAFGINLVLKNRQ